MDENRVNVIESNDIKYNNFIGIKGIVQYDINNPSNLTNLNVVWFARYKNEDGYFMFKDEAALRAIVGNHFFKIMLDGTIKEFMRKIQEGRLHEDPNIITSGAEEDEECL